MTSTRFAPRVAGDLPAVRRLAALAPLDAIAEAALVAAAQRSRTLTVRRDLVSEGQELGDPLLVLDGWAARVRQLADGRRQIVNFVLPGDVIGLCGYDHAVAANTVVTFTPIVTCRLPDRAVSPALDRAYAISRAMEEAHLMAQVTRLGRLNAYERIADFLLELHDRLSLAGLVEGGGFAMPLTQETLADTLGLTSVHINRMLQQARRAGDLQLSGGRVSLADPARLAKAIGRQPVRVVA